MLSHAHNNDVTQKNWRFGWSIYQLKVAQSESHNLMVGQILKHPTFTGYRLATDAVVRSSAFRSTHLRIIHLHQIRRHSTVRATFKPIGSSANVYSLRGSSPFTSSFRAYDREHVNIGLGLRSTQLGGVRHLSFSSVPKLLWTAFRLPVAGVTVGVAGVGYANYKIQGTTKSWGGVCKWQ